MEKQNEKKKGPSSIKDELIKVEEYLTQCKGDESAELNDLATLPNQHEIAFGISLKSKAVSQNWNKVQSNLSKTLRSILHNTDQHFRIIIAGHDKPNINELQHERVKWLPVEFPSPISSEGFSRDKIRKRKVIGEYLKKVGFSGYFMPVDADDWIHHRFVEYIRAQPFSSAFILEKGLILNIGRKEIWQTNGFYKRCGSNALFYLSSDDFLNTNNKKDSIFTILALKPHPKSPQRLEKLNRSYRMITHSLVVWVLGHGDNNSILKGKIGQRISAKDYHIDGEKNEEWLYDYFKIK
ncbi:hypothetical protein [Priestia megaterium]|uniref:hypothetical protein n=1 Tax=Priestia megaterium TaxID=1404 RepID=UPI003EEC1503